MIDLEHGRIRNLGLMSLCGVAATLEVSVADLARAYVDRIQPTHLDYVGRRDFPARAASVDGRVVGDPVAMGRALVRLRERKHLGGADLARIACVDRSHLARLERGEVRNPSLSTVVRVGAALPRNARETELLGLLVARLVCIFARERWNAGASGRLQSARRKL